MLIHLSVHSGVLSLALLSSGTLASGGRDGCVRLWDLKTGAALMVPVPPFIACACARVCTCCRRWPLNTAATLLLAP